MDIDLEPFQWAKCMYVFLFNSVSFVSALCLKLGSLLQVLVERDSAKINWALPGAGLSCGRPVLREARLQASSLYSRAVQFSLDCSKLSDPLHVAW